MYFFAEYIQGELDQRKNVNPRYSLRAFANFLQIDPSSLSAVLKSKRAYPSHKIEDLFKRLETAQNDRFNFLLSITQFQKEQKSIKHPKKKNETLPHKDEKTLLDEITYFEVLSEWDYYAILNLIEISPATKDNEYFSERLGLSTHRTEELLYNLVKLHLIQEKEDCYQRTFNDFVSTEDIPSKALVLGHQSEMNLAIQKIEELGPEHRDFYSITLKGSHNKLAEAKKHIRECKEKIEKLMENEEADEVYLFSTQLYPISHKVKQ